MEPNPLKPGPVPGLLVARETGATLPVVDAAPRTFQFPSLPNPEATAGGTSTSRRPSRTSPAKQQALRSARGAMRQHDPERHPLDTAHAQTAWLGISLIAAISTLGLLAALGLELLAPQPAPPLSGEHRPQGPQVALQPAPTHMALDPLVFHHDVEPILKAECWSCHGEVSGAGEFRLRTGEGGLDMRSVEPFVAPGRPDASLLLTKPLGSMWGGQAHSSSVTWKAGDPQVQLLERWISGSTVPSRITPDEENP